MLESTLTSTLDNLDYIMTPIGALLSWYLGGSDGFVIALIVFTVMDYVTGVLAAGVQHKLSSEVGFKGIAKKITIFILVGIAHIVDMHLLRHTFIGQIPLLRDAVIFFYLSNEGISILENAVRIGLPVPEALKNALEKIHNKHAEKKAA